MLKEKMKKMHDKKIHILMHDKKIHTFICIFKLNASHFNGFV